jgi:hypothetical protein
MRGPHSSAPTQRAASRSTLTCYRVGPRGRAGAGWMRVACQAEQLHNSHVARLFGGRGIPGPFVLLVSGLWCAEADAGAGQAARAASRCSAAWRAAAAWAAWCWASRRSAIDSMSPVRRVRNVSYVRTGSVGKAARAIRDGQHGAGRCHGCTWHPDRPTRMS